MKIFSKYLFAAAVLSLPLTACEGLLDINPETSIPVENALNTGQDVRSTVVGSYKLLGGAYLYGSRLIMNSELLADNGEVRWAGTYPQNREFWNKDITVLNPDVRSTWLDAYRLINSTNIVLSKLDVFNSVELEKGQKELTEGEAKFVRAVTYFELVRLYAKSYDAATAGQNKGVPIVLTPTLSEADLANPVFRDRTTVKAVYDQVIKDLNDAARLLPTTNGRYASRMTTLAMLSRVYMQMGDHQKALDAANEVIKSDIYKLTDKYADAFNKNTNTTEDIFAIQSTKQDNNNDVATFYAGRDLGARRDVRIQTKHIEMYEFMERTAAADFTVTSRDYFYSAPKSYTKRLAAGAVVKAGTKYYVPEDRFTLFYTDRGNTSILTGKWKNVLDGNVNIVRLAEMYLTRAEANFVLGKSVGATPAEDINRLRARVGLPAIPAASLTLDNIKRERRIELAHEGHRLHDAKRWKETISGLPYNSPKLVLPIPQTQLDITPELGQNEGY